MPFFNSKSAAKELIKYNFYDEARMNELCSIDSPTVIRFQCCFDFK